MSIFKMIQLPSDEPIQFVGVYVLRWGETDEPTVAFREAEEEEIIAAYEEIMRSRPQAQQQPSPQEGGSDE